MDSRAARAEKYRSKAEVVRIIAEAINDPAARATLLSVARDYLNLARMTESIAMASDPLPELSDPKIKPC